MNVQEPVRFGFKQTEVGVVPEDWAILPSTALGSIQTGPFGTVLKASEYSRSEGVPIVSVGEIGEGRIVLGDRTPLAPIKVTKRLPVYVLREGDIVFGRKGAVDRSCLVREEEDGWFLGSDGIRLRPSKATTDPNFLAAQLQLGSVRSWLMQHATGTTMATLNHGVLNRLLLKLPPLHEQRAIAAALSDVDALVAALDTLIAKKRNIKQAAMQQLLTGKTRLPGFRGEWKVKLLGDIAQFYKGRGLPKAGINNSGNTLCVHYGELFSTYDTLITRIFSRTDHAPDAFFSRKNDVLMPTSDVTPNGLAKASCIKSNDVVLGGDILVIRVSNRFELRPPFRVQFRPPYRLA